MKKSKKSNSVKDLITLLAFSLPVNTVGVQTWKESWKPKLLETPKCLLTCFPKRLWKSMQTILLSKSWKRKLLTQINLIRPLEIWSGFFSILLCLLPDFHWMNPLNSDLEFIEWSNWVWASMMTMMTRCKMKCLN